MSEVHGIVTVEERTVTDALVTFHSAENTQGTETDSFSGFYALTLTPGLYSGAVEEIPEAICPRIVVNLREGERREVDFPCELLAGLWELAYQPRSNTCAIPAEPFTATYDLETAIDEAVADGVIVEMDHEGAPTLSGTYDHGSSVLAAETEWTDVGNDTEVKEEIELELQWSLELEGEALLGTGPRFGGSSTLYVQSTSSEASCQIESDVEMIMEGG